MRYKDKNGNVRRQKLGIKINSPGQSDPQPTAPVSPSVKFNPNIGLGVPIQINTGGGNPFGGKLPPPPKKEKFPDPLIPKGLDIPDSPPPDFVRQLEEQKQLDPLTGKKYTLDQTRIQAQGLQLGNFSSIPFKLSSFTTGTNAYIEQTFNTLTGSSIALTDYISFGDYYNVLGVEIQYQNIATLVGTDENSFAEFYLMQLGGQDASLADPQLYNKIPVQTSRNLESSNVTWETTGEQFGYEKIMIPFGVSPLFNFSLKQNTAPRTYGLALSQIVSAFSGSFDTSAAVINGIIYVDKSTAGQNL
mgnify:CR=1 FL=1